MRYFPVAALGTLELRARNVGVNSYRLVISLRLSSCSFPLSEDVSLQINSITLLVSSLLSLLEFVSVHIGIAREL
jgi:hypothetical protein